MLQPLSHDTTLHILPKLGRQTLDGRDVCLWSHEPRPKKLESYHNFFKNDHQSETAKQAGNFVSDYERESSDFKQLQTILKDLQWFQTTSIDFKRLQSILNDFNRF